MVEMILAFVVGGALMWGATKWYYTKATAEDKATLKKYEDLAKAQGIILRE